MSDFTEQTPQMTSEKFLDRNFYVQFVWAVIGIKMGRLTGKHVIDESEWRNSEYYRFF